MLRFHRDQYSQYSKKYWPTLAESSSSLSNSIRIQLHTGKVQKLKIYRSCLDCNLTYLLTWQNPDYKSVFTPLICVCVLVFIDAWMIDKINHKAFIEYDFNSISRYCLRDNGFKKILYQNDKHIGQGYWKKKNK